MKSYSRYLLSIIFTILGAITVLNWLVNPYDIFPSPEIEGFNGYKSEVGRHTRLSKAYKVGHLVPDTILLASSRGLEIPVDYFTAAGDVGMNLSLASASTYELLRMLQHAQATSPLKMVVLALDEKFADTTQPNFLEQRLLVDDEGVENTGLLKTKIQDMFFSLLSLDAFRSSLRTLKKQDEDPATMDYEAYKAARVYNAGGHRQMFRTLESSMLSAMDSNSQDGYSDSCQPEAIKESDKIAANEGYFRRIIELAYSNEIELYIYFSPVHARFYETKCLLGQWNAMERMKRSVVGMVETMSEDYDRPAFKIWDFSGYNRITSEAVPVYGDKTSTMNGYWEGSHYTLETAAAVFNVMFDGSEQLSGFGRRLHAASIEDHLLDIRQQQRVYVDSHGDDVRELSSIIKASEQR